MKIDELIEDLYLIGTVTPDYIRGRGIGLADSETEKRAEEAIGKAIEILEIIREGMKNECR